MTKPFELGPEDTLMINQFEQNLVQFLMAYSSATGINYWSLILFLFDIAHGALSQADRTATINLLDATAKALKAEKNTPDTLAKRRKAMKRLLERGQFLLSPTQGSA